MALMQDSFDLPNSPRRLEKMASDQLLGRLGGGSFLHERKYDVRKGAEHLGISTATLRRLIQNGDIPILRIGGRIFLLERDLDEFLQGNYSAQRPAKGKLSPSRERLPDKVLNSKHLR